MERVISSQSQKRTTSCKPKLVDKFVNALKISFADPSNKTTAMRSLKAIKQNNGSVNELNTHFRLLILKAGLDMFQNATLVRDFSKP